MSSPKREVGKDSYYQKLLDDEMRQQAPNWKSVRQYINMDVLPSPVDRTTGMAMIHIAAYFGESVVLKWCIDKRKSSIHQTNEFGRTALHMSADANRPECISILLENGADVNKTSLGGLTALHVGCRNNSVQAVSRLLESPDIDLDAETVERSVAESLTDNQSIKDSISACRLNRQ